MTVTDVRPLAGVRFEDLPPVSPRALPRMDVVGFVGYASTGPVHTPVAVESVEDFRRVFGDEVQLGWDAVRRRGVTSQLGAAVRDFFVNGGVRAWVVRVAGEDVSQARAPLPGILALDGSLAPGTLVAASPGAAGGRAGLACAAVVDAVDVVGPGPRGTRLVRSRGGLVVGDLVRATRERRIVLVRVDQVSAPRRQTRTARTPLGGLPVVEQDVLLSAPLVTLPLAVALLRRTGSALVVDGAGEWHEVRASLAAADASRHWTHGQSVTLELSGVLAAPGPAVGGWVRLPGWVDDDTVPTDAWATLEEVVASATDEHAWVVRGRVCVPVLPASADEPRSGPADDGWVPSRLERITLEVHGGRDDEVTILTGTGLLPGHPRFLGDLPDLAGRHRADDQDRAPWRDRGPVDALPWAGAGGAALLPVLTDELPTPWTTAYERPGRTSLELDGLAAPDSRAFVDERLVGCGVDTLVARAEDLRWRDAGRPPRGIHALLGVDEVTVVAVPDAAQVGWCAATAPEAGAPPASDDDAPPDGCGHGDFGSCRALARPFAPRWRAPEGEGERLRLAWTGGLEEAPTGNGADPTYEVEESVDPTGWSDARVVHRGPAAEVDVPARSTIPRYFRVRAVATTDDESLAGRWSEGLAVEASPGLGVVAVADADYRPHLLLDVQRALLRMCAARGDLLAVLSVPEHFRADTVAGHVAALTEPKDEPAAGERVLPLGPWETPVLGYGALYHPWLVHGSVDTASAATSVPDGAVAGVVAARARTRGAWVAPANQPLHDTVALVRDEGRDARRALRGLQVNVASRSRGDFSWLSEDTLSTDPDWRPVSVRRLHALVRRVVLLEGPHHVFEPNDPVLRRSVERGFVELMRTLFGWGAFAGAVEREAFRVTVGEVNTPASVELGRLVVEIAYAPSRPLELVRVRLVHAGEPGYRLVDA